MSRKQPKNLLFLCTGNYYRSRFAEIYFNELARKMSLPWRADSRGLAIERGVNNVGPIAHDTLQALAALGVRAPEAVARFPVALSAAELEAAHLIIALKQTEHLPLFEERFPAWAEKVEFWHIDDAPGALALIEQEIMALIARLCGGGQAPPETAPSPPVREIVAKPKTVKVGRETAGRRGKGVTTVFDTALDEQAIEDLAATLKQRCGTGGTVKNGRIEIQGDQRDRIVAELEKLGYKVKKAGG